MRSPTEPRAVLLLATHPVQYAAPLFRRMAEDPRLSIQVAYLSMAGAHAAQDEGFGMSVQWDIPLLDGYPWTEVSSLPGLVRTIHRRRWDAIISYTGYRHAAFWLALSAAKLRGIPYLFGTDAHGYAPRAEGGPRPALKRVLLPWLFRLADVSIVPSSASRDFLLGMGLAPRRVVLTPYVVDNTWWIQQAAAVDRAATRAQWCIPDSAVVLLFVAKLQPWKGPLELLRAFARLGASPDVFLVFAGSGPLREEIEREAAAAGVSSRVRLLGFVNQTRLPSVYRAADVFVLPSTYEPFGVVVNEAMLCGCAVVVSDRVGAARDLVQGNGLVYPSGDIAALAELLETLTRTPTVRDTLAQAGRSRINTWSPEANVDATIAAVDAATARRHA